MDASKTVTRNDLYDTVHRKVGLSLRESADLTELVLKEISDCVVRGEAVKLSGFGTLPCARRASGSVEIRKPALKQLSKPDVLSHLKHHPS